MTAGDTEAVSKGAGGFVVSVGKFTIGIAIRKDCDGVSLVLRLHTLG